MQEELTETKYTLEDVQDDLTETKEKVNLTHDILTKKSKVSTRNPKSERDHHYFVATTIDMVDGTRFVKFTTGAKSYVEKRVAKLMADQNHKIIIPMFYNANGFDLRKNGKAEFVKFIKQRLAQINRLNIANVRKFNRALLAEIRAYNHNNPDDKRVYMNEKRDIPKKLKPDDIPIEYKVTSFKYRTNPHMSFDDVLKIVIDTNTATQKNPLAKKA